MYTDAQPRQKTTRLNIVIDVDTRRRFKQFMVDHACKNEREALKELLTISEGKQSILPKEATVSYS